LSYYPYVENIIATYDESHKSWSGPLLDIGDCIDRLRKIDVENKVKFVAGNFSRREFYSNPIENDTYQRQYSLDLASVGADWVLQIDTDEVITSWSVLYECVRRADDSCCESLYFPSIYVYQLISNRLALESCRRMGVRQAGYPGPIAVKSGTKLYLSRRTLAKPLHYRWETGFSTVIEPSAVVATYPIATSDCIVHFSRARSSEYMVKKFSTWGHAKDRDFSDDMRFWHMVAKYPIVGMVLSHCFRGPHVTQLRPFLLSEKVRSIIRTNNIDGSCSAHDDK
jgi:hypothetical protein